MLLSHILGLCLNVLWRGKHIAQMQKAKPAEAGETAG
jgi:hypothetical protein